MLETEIIEIISDELVDFFESYIVMTSMSHGFMNSLVDDKHILFDFTRHNGYNNHVYYHSRHGIYRSGRTKLDFHFRFYKNELEFALKLVRLLDGYIDYSFSDMSNGTYSYYFKFDAGDQNHATVMFEKLKGIS